METRAALSRDCKDQELAIGDYVIITEGFRDRIYVVAPWGGKYPQEEEDVLWVTRWNGSNKNEEGWARTKHILKIPKEYATDKRKLDAYLRLGGMKD